MQAKAEQAGCEDEEERSANPSVALQRLPVATLPEQRVRNPASPTHGLAYAGPF